MRLCNYYLKKKVLYLYFVILSFRQTWYYLSQQSTFIYYLNISNRFICKQYRMKITIFLALFVFSNLIFISAGDHCQCECCIPVPNDTDCQVELVGTAAIDSCPVDSTLICAEKCRQQFPAKCNQNNSIVEGGCSFDSTSSMKPTTTTILNGPVECKCSCCVGTPCNATYAGSVIAENCHLCQKKCDDNYLPQCTQRSATIVIQCEAAPHGNACRVDLNIMFLFSFILFKHFFL